MIRIGEFSRLSQISIKALRHYDNLGLIQPEHIDKFTGYRYYTLQQLPCAHQIMALKEMGLSLEQIGIMLNQDLSIEELRGMLRLKQAEIEQQVREEQQRLAMVEFHLNMINTEDKMSELNIVVKEIPTFKALYLRFYPKEGQIPSIAAEVQKLIANGTIKHTGKWMGITYAEPINPEEYEFGFTVPVTDEQTDDIELSSGDTLALTTMPAVLAATIVVQGHGEKELLQNRVLLAQWATENGYTPCDENRAIHHKGPMHNAPQSEWLTELQAIIEPQS